ncbi:MAG: Spy/CpxP family protein refolding chaperone, partial [Gemmatimonadota bacterium]
GSMMGGEGGGSMMGGEGGGSMMGGESGGSMMGGEGGGSMMGGEGRGSMMGGEGMVAIMGTKLSTILRQKDALGLTETQIQDVEAVQQRLGQRHETHKEDMKAMAARRAEILGEDQPDLEDLESILSKEADERVEMHMYMARSGREALQLLSEEQRSNLQYARRLSHNGMKGSGSTRHH